MRDVEATWTAMLGTQATSSSSTSSSTTATRWEELRRQARTLENQVDGKLIALNQLSTSIPSNVVVDKRQDVKNGDNEDEEKRGLLAADNDDDNDLKLRQASLERTSDELDSLLNNLSSVQSQMADLIASQPTPVQLHTLQRHRDILQDYREEYRKTRSQLEQSLRREALLSSSSAISTSKTTKRGLNNARIDILLRESESARNAERLIDEQISIALEGRDSLVNQRLAFKALQTKLNDLTHRFPLINSLVQKIHLRKRRDTVILGVVIGLCLFVLIWYTLG